MIVLDASVVVEILTNGVHAAALRLHLDQASDSLIVPHLLDVEAASALRKLVTGQRIDVHHSEEILRNLAQFPAERYPHTPLLKRIWQLRHNFTAYDATYIALAEVTGATLYTCDGKLVRGHHAKVMLFS